MYFVFKTLAIIWRECFPFPYAPVGTSNFAVMLPATRGAEVLYVNVVRPALGNVKARAQRETGSTNPFQKDSGFNAAGTTAPSSFEREYGSCLLEDNADSVDEKTL